MQYGGRANTTRTLPHGAEYFKFDSATALRQFRGVRQLRSTAGCAFYLSLIRAINVLQFQSRAARHALGADQIAWLTADLKGTVSTGGRPILRLSPPCRLGRFMTLGLGNRSTRGTAHGPLAFAPLRLGHGVNGIFPYQIVPEVKATFTLSYRPARAHILPVVGKILFHLHTKKPPPPAECPGTPPQPGPPLKVPAECQSPPPSFPRCSEITMVPRSGSKTPRSVVRSVTDYRFRFSIMARSAEEKTHMTLQSEADLLNGLPAGGGAVGGIALCASVKLGNARIRIGSWQGVSMFMPSRIH